MAEIDLTAENFGIPPIELPPVKKTRGRPKGSTRIPRKSSQNLGLSTLPTDFDDTEEEYIAPATVKRGRKATPPTPAEVEVTEPETPDIPLDTCNVERRSYRLTGITPILGSQPASPAIRTLFLASKAPDPAAASAENELLPDDKESSGLTVFLRQPDTDALGIMSYVIRGQIKNALTCLAEQNGIKQPRAKVDRYLFAFWARAKGPNELFIPLLRDGEPIFDEDDQLERSLRAETMQGPRTGLAASELVNDPWTLEISLELLPNAGSKKSKSLNWAAIEQALTYGRYCGLGQWRNAGYGRFTWERIE